MSPPASTEKTQFFLLTRHFFNRFFRTNLVNSAAQMDLTVIHILSVLAIPGLLFSLWIYPDHAYLVTNFPLWVETERALRDKAFFCCVLHADHGFPDGPRVGCPVSGSTGLFNPHTVANPIWNPLRSQVRSLGPFFCFFFLWLSTVFPVSFSRWQSTEPWGLCSMEIGTR